MHFDIETLSLSVAKTARELEKVYDEHGNASSAAIDLFKIYLLQFVLDDTSVYSPYIREQSLIALREKIHKKEPIGMGNIEQDPKAVERVLIQVANELVREVKSIEQLINNPDALSEKLENWQRFVEMEKNLGARYKDLRPALHNQLKNIMLQENGFLSDSFKSDIEILYYKQINSIKNGVRGISLCPDFSKVCADAEKIFVADIHKCFAFYLADIEKVEPVVEYQKKRFLREVDNLLNKYQNAPQDFTVAMQQYREKSDDNIGSFYDDGEYFSMSS